MLRLTASFVVAAALAPVAQAAGTRIVYASGWEGPTQLFAADPANRAPTRQVTFGRRS